MKTSWCNPVALAGIRVRKIHQGLFFSIAMVFSTATVEADSPAPQQSPSLEIFQGDYLLDYNPGMIFVSEGNLYQKGVLLSGNQLLSFQATGTIPNPESCWKMGHNIIKGNTTDLACDISVNRTPDTLSRFLYSALVPYGSYLNYCTGVARTQENGRKYLYASCRNKGNTGYNPNKLDITECQGNIFSSAGVLKCSSHPVKRKHLLTGSYMECCDVAVSEYNPDTDELRSRCWNRIYWSRIGLAFERITSVLSNAGDCIGAGKDIVFANSTLTCIDDPSKEVVEHIAGLYLPAGNYLLTCTKMAFYPCMGRNNNGFLAAYCANKYEHFEGAQLEDANERCRMSELGYVSNINGALECDPDIEFIDEDPSQGSALLPHFQCNQE